MERTLRFLFLSLFAAPLSLAAQDVVNIDCSLAVPVDQAYCYNDEEEHDWTYTSAPTGFLKLIFTEGQIESAEFDSLFIYDGTDATGTLLFQHTEQTDDDPVDLSGLTVYANSGSLFMRMRSDEATSCDDGEEDEWHWTVECVTCVPPAATFTVVPDCINDQFNLDVNITDLGSSIAADILVNGVVQATSVGVGVTSVGPFPSGSPIGLDVANTLDHSCTRPLGSLNGLFSCNDDCAQAIPLTVNPDLSCGTVTAGTVENATPSGLTTTCGGTPDDDVWFSFVATATGHQVKLSDAAGSVTNLYQALWTGVDCASLTQVPGACSDPNTMNVGGLIVGQTYYVQVYTNSAVGGQNTTFNICVGTLPPPPANDQPCGALPVAVNPGLTCDSPTAGTVEWATASGLTTTCNGTPDDDVWFSFVATATGHQISLRNINGSAFDLFIAVWTGADCSTLTQVANTCSDLETMVANGLTPGNTYYIQVYTYTPDGGQNTTFNVCVGTLPPPPANDNACGAAPVTVNPDLECGVTTPGTVASATPSGLTTTCGGTPDDDVWFSFVATAAAHPISLIDIDGSTEDLYMAVWRGTDCSTLTLVPGTCSDPQSQVAGGLVAGQTYYIQVYSYTSTTGQTSTFNVCVGTLPPPPANDDPCGAAPLTVNGDFECGITTPGTVQSATPTGLATTCGGTADDDVWFSFTATGTSHRISLLDIDGSESDMYLAVWAGTDCSSLTLVPNTCSDPENVSASGLTVGQTYYVQVYTYTSTFGQTSTFDVCVGTPPPPPGCGGVFYDNGGPNEPYSPNTSEVTTFCPDVPGQLVSLVFTSFSTEASYDKLFVFNGPDVSAPMFASTNGEGNGNTTYGPGGWWGSINPGTFTSTDPSGCLTVAFVSDGNAQPSGWEANVLCIAAVNCDEWSPSYTYCYGNNENQVFSYAGSGGLEPMTIVFAQGRLLVNDYLVFYDGLAPQGTPLFTGNNGGDLESFGVSGTPGAFGICFKIVSNGGASCADGTADTEMIWGVGCGTDWVGLGEHDAWSDVSIYPNPAQDRLSIALPPSIQGQVEFRLMDLTGRLVLDRMITASGGMTVQLDLPELPSGNYSLVMIGKDRVTARKVQVMR